MKHIVSISLGSSERDHHSVETIGGQPVAISRIGTDGSIKKAMELIRQMDGQVDAFGLGGTDLYIYAGGKQYTFRESARLAGVARKTPVVDGSGLKNTLERRVIQFLDDQRIVQFQNTPVLLVCAVDRFGMAEALAERGSKLVFGDLLFGVGLPLPLHTLTGLARLARCLAPVITRLPVRFFYPTGLSQREATPRFGSYFREAAVIAGDFHYIRRYMPDSLAGKSIITNTVTAQDMALLKERGVKTLITTTPWMSGRSCGTNVLEGVLVALAGKRPEELTGQDYERWLTELDIRPRIECWG